MDSATTLSAPQGQGTTISQSEADALWNSYQKQQATALPQPAPQATVKTISPKEADKLYKDYTKQQTVELGNALRSDPDSEDKFNAYRDAVQSYYQSRGSLGTIADELTPDKETFKNLGKGGLNFLKQQWNNIQKAAESKDPMDVYLAIQRGSSAAGVDLAMMLPQLASLAGEKQRVLTKGGGFLGIPFTDSDFSTPAQLAAERLRTTAQVERGVNKYILPQDEASKGFAELSRFTTGVLLPVGGAGKATKALGAAKTAQAAETVAEAATEAGRFADIGATTGKYAGGVIGATKGGLTGATVGAATGEKLGRAVGGVLDTGVVPGLQVAKGAIGGGIAGSAVGGVLGAGTVAAQEPVGTPVSQGVVPGAAIGGAAGTFLGAKGALAERNAPKADFFRDLDGGGAVRFDIDRWAMEMGPGVADLAQKFEAPNRVTEHRDVVSSYQYMKPNPRYGAGDPVIRVGYDPETRSLQTVVGESTKFDYVPRNRYVYQNVSPELAQRIMDAPSIEKEIRAIANEGGYGIGYTRPVITDAQLNSLIADLNSGKIDFHPKWGFSKGTGTPPESQFRVPDTSKVEPTPTPKSAEDFANEEWNPAFFEAAGRKAGEAYKGVREAFGTMEEGERAPAASERVSDADIARFRRESRTRGAPVEEPQKALGAAPERRALAAAAPLPEPQPVLGTTEVRRPMLQEPTERVQRREDVEAAFAEEDARLAREEQIRQSPLGAEALRGILKKRAQDAERRQRYKEEGRVPLASYRKKAGVEFPPSEEALRQANVEATPAPVAKEPDAPFEASATVPPGKTARDAKRMSQRMREIDAELMGTSGPKTRVKLLEERLELAAELGNEKAAEALSKWQQPNVEAEFYSDVRKLVNESGITNDPKYKNAGEVNLLRESGINFKSFKKGGKTLDELGETIAEKAVEYGLMLGDQATWDINSTTRFIADAFAAPRTAEPPVVGQPPIEGRAVKPKQPAPKKAKAESEEVTSVKDLRAQKKKAAIAEELAGKFAEPAPKDGKKVTLEQPAEKPAPTKTSTPPSKPTTKSYEDEIYRISQVVPPGPVSPKVVGMIADGVVKKGLLTADEVTGVRKISDLNKLLQDKIDAKKEIGSKQYWSAESLNLESMKTSPSERAGAAPYTLIVDGKTKRYWSLSALDKVLKSISSEKPRIFKNADKGITINFDS